MSQILFRPVEPTWTLSRQTTRRAPAQQESGASQAIGDPSMPTIVDIRNQTLEDFDSAVIAAECRREPWARCQALACVARFGPEHRVVEIAWRAHTAAQDGSDSYQRVFPAAWPLRALIERDLHCPAPLACTTNLTVLY